MKIFVLCRGVELLFASTELDEEDPDDSDTESDTGVISEFSPDPDWVEPGASTASEEEIPSWLRSSCTPGIPLCGICKGVGVTSSAPLDSSWDCSLSESVENGSLGLLPGSVPEFDSCLLSGSPPGIPFLGIEPGERPPVLDAPLNDPVVECVDAADAHDEVPGSFNEPCSWTSGSAGFEPVLLLSEDPPGIPFSGIGAGDTSVELTRLLADSLVKCVEADYVVEEVAELLNEPCS